MRKTNVDYSLSRTKVIFDIGAFVVLCNSNESKHYSTLNVSDEFSRGVCERFGLKPLE